MPSGVATPRIGSSVSRACTSTTAASRPTCTMTNHFGSRSLVEMAGNARSHWLQGENTKGAEETSPASPRPRNRPR